MTEKEAVLHQIKSLDFCTILEEDGIISLEDLNTLIPGYFHLNNGKTIALEYVSSNGLEFLQTSMEEIKLGGIEFVKKIIDLKSQQFLQILPQFFEQGDKNKPMGYLQRIRYTEKHPFDLYFTTVKIYRNNTSLISFTQPVKALEEDKYLKEIVDFRFDFFSKYYHNFQKLTKREKEILGLIADGISTIEISERLFISDKTTSTHRQNIIRKLETNKLSDLIKYAIAFGLIKY